MKRLALVGALLLPISAHAAWFCGEEPTEFAQNRASSAFSGARINSDMITFGSQNLYSMVCEATKEGGSICRAESSAPPTPQDYTAQVDAYEAKVNDFDAWAGTLSDGCLKDAYKNVSDKHREIIKKDRRAIEFMKSPAPFSAQKGGS